METLHIIADTQESQQQVRGRPKYPSYQNFKGRKSSSMMNLCGKEHHKCHLDIHFSQIPFSFKLLNMLIIKNYMFLKHITKHSL